MYPNSYSRILLSNINTMNNIINRRALMKRIPEVVIFDHHYPSGHDKDPGRKNDREIDLLCTMSGYKIIKSTLDELESSGRVRFIRFRSSNGMIV